MVSLLVWHVHRLSGEGGFEFAVTLPRRSSFNLIPCLRGFLEGCRTANLPIGRTGTLHTASPPLNPLGTRVAAAAEGQDVGGSP